MRKTSIIMATAMLTLSACAKGPDAIAAVPMGDVYQSLSCSTARNMLVQERNTLAPLEDQQRGAVTGDALGVFLIGVPVSSLSGGDREGQIAASKGKILALEARLATCG